MKKGEKNKERKENKMEKKKENQKVGTKEEVRVIYEKKKRNMIVVKRKGRKKRILTEMQVGRWLEKSIERKNQKKLKEKRMKT